MSALVPGALIEGFSSPIALTASTIHANYAVLAPAYYILMTNLGYDYQEEIALNM